MGILDEVQAQYIAIDDAYASIEVSAKIHGWNRKKDKYKRKRDLNDQAYFLFLFTRFEDRIRQQSALLITNKQQSISSWRERASWDILPSGAASRAMPFKNRLALLLKKGDRDYNLVMQYYDERNSIAHGGSFISDVNISNVILNLQRLYRVVKA